MEYQFTFYDTHYGTIRSVVGLVTNLYDDQIKIKYIEESDTVDCKHCNKNCSLKPKPNSNQPPLPTCNCILNPPDTSKYNGPKTFFIPIQNIMSVSYIKTPVKPGPGENTEKGETKVMLLGISATMVKAIIIRLEFIDDSIEEAVKYVDLQAGGIYDIAYESRGSIFESRAKVVRIEEIHGDEHFKPGKGFVREHVANHNAIYNSCCHPKEEYMKAPPVSKVRIIVDTSELFTGRYETIMLDAIRNCTMVQAPDSSPVIPDGNPCDCCEFKTADCDPTDCPHILPPHRLGKPGHGPYHPGHDCQCDPKIYTYNFDNKFKVDIKGEEVSITSRNGIDKISLNDLAKFYLGID